MRVPWRIERLQYRLPTRVLSAALWVVCAVRGHDIDQHFLALFRGDEGWVGEVPWCSRCGRDFPEVTR